MNQEFDGLLVMLFENQQAFETWLEAQQGTSRGIWLRIAKKNSGVTTVSYSEALEAALCFGWVDSRKEKMDANAWLQRFTPRGSRSIWSKVNKEKAESLIAADRMRPAGFQAIEAAKQNGLWEKAYEPQSADSMPEDFAAELDRHPKAKSFYETLNRQNKFAILFRINNCKKPETRKNRKDKFIGMLERGEKLYP